MPEELPLPNAHEFDRLAQALFSTSDALDKASIDYDTAHIQTLDKLAKIVSGKSDATYNSLGRGQQIDVFDHLDKPLPLDGPIKKAMEPRLLAGRIKNEAREVYDKALKDLEKSLGVEVLMNEGTIELLKDNKLSPAIAREAFTGENFVANLVPVAKGPFKDQVPFKMFQAGEPIRPEMAWKRPAKAAVPTAVPPVKPAPSVTSKPAETNAPKVDPIPAKTADGIASPEPVASAPKPPEPVPTHMDSTSEPEKPAGQEIEGAAKKDGVKTTEATEHAAESWLAKTWSRTGGKVAILGGAAAVVGGAAYWALKDKERKDQPQSLEPDR